MYGADQIFYGGKAEVAEEWVFLLQSDLQFILRLAAERDLGPVPIHRSSGQEVLITKHWQGWERVLEILRSLPGMEADELGKSIRGQIKTARS